MNTPERCAKACPRRRRTDRFVWISACFVAVACGGTVSQGGGAQPDGGVLPESGVDAANDCSGATQGGTCTHEGEICRSHCPDPCTFCSFLACSGGQWMPGEDAPAQSCSTDGGLPDVAPDAAPDATPIAFNFPCGPAAADGGGLECFFPTQFCEESGGGPPPPPDAAPFVGYTCNPFPPACQSTPTCACLMANGSFCSGVAGGMIIGCTENGGAPTVACAFP
jgi:hypothetical protein